MNEFIVSYISIFLIILGFLTILLFVIVLILFSSLRATKKKLSVFMTGSDAHNLESTLLSQIKHSQKVSEDVKELFIFNKKIHELAHKGLYKIGFLRFNPFKDVGGNQSFAVALLDGKQNGIVISSLYTKEGTRVYAKPVQDGLGLKQYPLTEEEQKAISTAHSQKYISEQ